MGEEKLTRSHSRRTPGQWIIKRHKGPGVPNELPETPIKPFVGVRRKSPKLKVTLTSKCAKDWEHFLVFYKITGYEQSEHRAVINAVREGLSTDAIDVLVKALNVNLTEFFDISGIPKSTLSRRRKTGTLTPEESDRLVRLARIKDLALEMMEGDDDAAKEWLNTPIDLLGGETPIRYSNTEIGARDVESLIGRIRMGVFS